MHVKKRDVFITSLFLITVIFLLVLDKAIVELVFRLAHH